MIIRQYNSQLYFLGPTPRLLPYRRHGALDSNQLDSELDFWKSPEAGIAKYISLRRDGQRPLRMNKSYKTVLVYVVKTYNSDNPDFVRVFMTIPTQLLARCG